jgi:catechol 2,3-dioxygenase
MTDEETLSLKPRVRRTHVALYVKNPFESAPWYADVLGMQETARGERWVFMSFGEKHHDIALIQADPVPEGADPRGVINMQHYGLEVEGTLEDLQRLHGMLLRKGVPIFKTTDHHVGIGLYFTDPDGHRFEFFHETVHDNEEGKRLLGLYHAPSKPFDLPPL